MIKKVLTLFVILLTIGIVLIDSQVRSDIPVAKLQSKYTNQHSNFVQIGGMQVHYRDEGDGRPLLLLHGVASSLHTWNGWTKLLKSDFRIIRVDLPGFGLTGPHASHDYSMPAYVEFIGEFLDAVGVQTCLLAGSSLGGQIAWEFAARHPDRVQRMILIGATGYPVQTVPLPFRLARTPVLNAVARYVTPRPLVAMSLKEVYFNDGKVTDELVDRYCDIALRQGNREALIIGANTTFEQQQGVVHTIEIPTLIMWGRQDAWVPVEDAYRFHADLPNSQLIIYDGAGHIPMEEIPVQSSQDAARFLASSELLSASRP